MRMWVIYCNKCGKEIKKQSEHYFVKMGNRNRIRREEVVEREYHLCEDCAKKLEEQFMNCRLYL